MCGIAGVLLRDRSADVRSECRRVDAALTRLRHRGPDDSGVYEGDGVLLGNRRLAILDLTPGGHQPMVSREGDFALVLNGEIYNYVELRATLESHGHTFRTTGDTEVLLAAWRVWGIGALERLHGMFAFAVWDVRARRLSLARDRLGEKPLFYWRDGARFAFASEIKGLVDLLPSAPPLSPTAIDTFLHYQYVIEPETPLEGVAKLPAGHVLEIGVDRWGAAPRAYWDVASVPAVDGAPAECLRGALERAIELTLRSDADVGIALSGGLDSAVIAALATRTRKDVAAFTVGYPGHPSFDERHAARQLADRLSIPHVSAELSTDQFAAFFPELVSALDEPIGDIAAYGHYAVAQLAARHGMKVLLTGIGGDELFFGYGWVREAVRLSRLKRHAVMRPSGFDRLRADLQRLVLGYPAILHAVANRRFPEWWRHTVERRFDYGRLDLEHPDEWVFYQLDYHWDPARQFTTELFSDAVRRTLPERHAFSLMRGLARDAGDPQFEIWQRLVDSWLVSNCLALGDRVSMAVSVEARIPLIERTVVETVIGLWKAGHLDDANGHKVWLRAAMADVLPDDVLTRPKSGFVTPTREWMTAVIDRYASTLADGALVQRGILDGGRLRRWMAGAASLHRDFFQYKLTQLELWTRLVAEGQRTAELTYASQGA
jgi:asparagine synthase (glutamine-hydrolysing)